MERARRRRLVISVGSAAALWACSASCGSESNVDRTPGSETPSADASDPPTANRGRLQRLRAFQRRVRHAADGVGRAWLERDPEKLAQAVSATPDRFTIVFEVGPPGISHGGSIHFQLPQIGGWSIPQISRPQARGYTTVEPSADDIDLELHATAATKSVAIRVMGRALRPGERLRIVYGAGPGFALPDRYAEKGARLWIAVDGDGDGSHSYLEASPKIDVLPGKAALLLVTAPTTARPGDTVSVRIAVLDAHRNAGPAIRGEITLRSVPPGLTQQENSLTGYFSARRNMIWEV